MSVVMLTIDSYDAPKWVVKVYFSVVEFYIYLLLLLMVKFCRRSSS